MVGYEELTPEQIIYIFNIIGLAMIIFSIAMVIRSFIYLKISKNLTKLELLIENKINNGLTEKKPSLFTQIKLWWEQRKLNKIEKKKYKPIGEF